MDMLWGYLSKTEQYLDMLYMIIFNMEDSFQSNDIVITLQKILAE